MNESPLTASPQPQPALPEPARSPLAIKQRPTLVRRSRLPFFVGVGGWVLLGLLSLFNVWVWSLVIGRLHLSNQPGKQRELAPQRLHKEVEEKAAEKRQEAIRLRQQAEAREMDRRRKAEGMENDPELRNLRNRQAELLRQIQAWGMLLVLGKTDERIEQERELKEVTRKLNERHSQLR